MKVILWVLYAIFCPHLTIPYLSLYYLSFRLTSNSWLPSLRLYLSGLYRCRPAAVFWPLIALWCLTDGVGHLCVTVLSAAAIVQVVPCFVQCRQFTTGGPLLCTVPPGELKKQTVVLKEDVMYQVRIHFYVQREIVQGLKYVQRTYKTGIRGTWRHRAVQWVWLLSQCSKQ